MLEIGLQFVCVITLCCWRLSVLTHLSDIFLFVQISWWRYFIERGNSLFFFSSIQTPATRVWCWQRSLNSSKSSNLCWFSDKPQHLVVLAWDAACTVGCCKLFAWSGPGTPHVMGNSLNSAHLGRQCRPEPLIFSCSSQPASLCCCHLPLTQQPLYLAAAPSPLQPYLRPLARAAILIKLSESVSGQAQTKRPQYVLAGHLFASLLRPNNSFCHRQQPRAQAPVFSLWYPSQP